MRGIFKPNFPTTNINGFDKIGSFLALNPFYTYTCVKNTDGNFFFAAMGTINKRRDPYVHRFNPTLNAIDQELRLPLATVTTRDVHRTSTFTHDASGNIIMASEIPNPATNGHGYHIKIHKTGTPGNIFSLGLTATITGTWSYPLIYNNGTTVFVSARGWTGGTFVRGEYWYCTSTNGGLTFGSMIRLYNSGDEQLVAYFQRIHDFSNNTTYMVLNERSNDDLNYPLVALVKTTDFITWSNIDGSFTKDVVASGAITRAEMVANCIVAESPTPLTVAVNFEGGCVKSNGQIRILVSYQLLTTNDIPDPTLGGAPSGIREVILDELRLYTYDEDDGWVYNNVDIPSNMRFYWATDKPMQYLNNDDAFDDVIFIDHTQNRDVYIKRSVDQFQTTTSIKKLSGFATKFRLGSCAYNVPLTKDNIIVLCDPVGDPIQAYFAEVDGPEDYSNIRILRLND